MFRFSLKQLLALVTLSALAVVSLKYASGGWLMAMGVLYSLALFAALVMAVVERDARQAFAIVFGVVMVSYLIVVLNMSDVSSGSNRNREFSTSNGQLPTSWVLGYLLESVSAQTEVAWDPGLNHLLQLFDTQAALESGQMSQRIGKYVVSFPNGMNAPPTVTRLVPTPKPFMQIGHLWWALLLGYCSGQIAKVAYLRRQGRSD